MKRAIYALVVVTAAVALGSCQLWDTLFPPSVLSVNETAVVFDGSGHVTQAITYTWNNGTQHQTESLGTDGSYEFINKTYDATSSLWKQTGGYKGTYSYTASTHMMSLTTNQVWPVNGSGYVGSTSVSTLPQTETWPALLTSGNDYAIYTGSAGTYTYTDTSTGHDGSGWKSTDQIVVAGDLSSVTETYTYLQTNSSGTTIYGYKSGRTVTVDQIFPSGVKSINDAKGKAVTASCLQSSSTPYTWVSGSSFTAGTPTTSNSSSSMTYIVASDGSWIAQAAYTAARNLRLQ